MKRLDEFRIFYNHTIHPELMRMEIQRKRLLRLMLISLVVLVCLLIFEFYISIWVITLMLMLPIGMYLVWLWQQAQLFRQQFKPNVVNLVLDFVDNAANYHEFSYDSKGFLPKSTFLESRIFATSAPIYEGEDLIKGKIGQMPFELCEILAQEFSRVDQQLTTVFKGILMKSTLPAPRIGNREGELLLLPRTQRQFLARSIRAFTWDNGSNIDHRMYDAFFLDYFMTYASPEVDLSTMLSVEMQQIIVDCCRKSDKDIYISFIESDIYIFLTEPKDFLEPFLFRPNISFQLVQEFFEDIEVIVGMIEDFDRLY